MNKIAF